MVVKQNWFDRMFKKPSLRTEVEMLKSLIGMQGQRGGARPNAGRKAKSQKLDEENKDKVNRMLQVRLDIMAQLHDPELMRLFIESLRADIASDKPHIRERAQKILHEVILKTPIPKMAEGEKDGVNTVAELLEMFEEKNRNGLLNDEEPVDDDSGSDPEPGEAELQSDGSELS